MRSRGKVIAVVVVVVATKIDSSCVLGVGGSCRVREGIIRHGQLTDISYVLVRIRVITSNDASTFCMLSDAHYDKLYSLFQVIYPLFATSTAFKSNYSKFSIRHGGIYFRVIKICSNYNHFYLRLE